VIRREEGFTLVELMITMVMFLLVLSATSGIFSALLNQFKQQSKIAETDIEGVVGLEMLRQDIESAGYGLPWDMGGNAYLEADVNNTTTWVDRDLNDGPPNNPARGADVAGASNPPGAVRALDNVAMNNTSDVLSIKSASVAKNGASQKWTELAFGGVTKNGLSGETFLNSDSVTVLSLIGNTFSLVGATVFSNIASLAPLGSRETRIVYGVDPNTNPLRFPFNRADYYVRVPTTVPNRCATGTSAGTDRGTGVLYKGVVSQADGTFGAIMPDGTYPNELPLLDCVASMQVVFGLDQLGNGTISYKDAGWLQTYTAADIRSQLKEVRVYILAQEGQRDPNYTFTNFTGGCPTCIKVGETGMGGNDFDLTAIKYYQNYRWKLYTIVARPGFI